MHRPRKKQKHRRFPRCSQLSRRQLDAAFYRFRLFRWTPSSERSQQDCADEHERRERRQKIQIQGTVHEWPPSWLPMNEH
jgi:hypothetical protein